MTKKMRTLLTIWLTLMTCSTWAAIEIDPQNIGDESIKQPAKRSPFSLDTHVDVMGSAKISKGTYKKDKVDYAEAEIEGGMVVYYCPTYTEGVRIAGGYFPVYLKWHDNPWFEQDHFNTISFSLSSFTQRIEDWFWRAQLTANFNADDWSGKYTSYDILLWGRYEFCRDIGVHFGFIAETGLRMDRIYPIIGFDWQISRKLKLSLVFPVNVSLIYSLTPHWSFGGACRFIQSRFRVNHNQHSLKPLVRYTNIGTELVVRYDNDTISGNVHVGSTWGGTYRVANHSNNHARHYYLKPSCYVGAEADVKF